MPFTVKEIRKEARPMMRLALPLVLSELGWMTMGVVDIMMVGRLPDSATAIGAVSLGSNIFFAIAIFGSGLMLGLDALVAQSYGKGDVDDCHHSLLNALYFSLLLGPLLMAFMWMGWPLLDRLGEAPVVMKLAGEYLNALVWATLPLLWYFALRRYLQSMDIVRPVMFSLVSANMINLIANWVFIFGHWGFHPMGAVGSGWATAMARLYMCIVLFLAVIFADRKRGTKMFASFAHRGFSPDFQRIKHIFLLGLPAALQLTMEVGVFATCTALIGRLGAVALAGSQVCLTTVSYTFMVPLGVSSAAAVRVGQAVGRKNFAAARQAGWTALLMGAGFMTMMSLLLWTVPGYIARIFTDKSTIVEASIPLLAVAAIFQIFDGVQIVCTGALRGVGDTKTAMYASLIAYWVIGLPVGYWLCFYRGMGAIGFWIGLCAGLIIVAFWVLRAWYKHSQGTQELLSGSSGS